MVLVGVTATGLRVAETSGADLAHGDFLKDHADHDRSMLSLLRGSRSSHHVPNNSSTAHSVMKDQNGYATAIMR